MPRSIERPWKLRRSARLGLAWGVILAATATMGLAGPAALASPAGPPPWLERLIRELKARPPGNPPQSVWRYRYRDQVVYYLPPQCCDQYSVLFDAEGRVIGAPDGGLTGGGDGRAGDFHQLRRQGLLLWRDPRGLAPR
ncbi:DUF6970 domain-containing protein [Synechococcus sp. CS-1332]|uniref:DUF6970 domain-containing protein n=1 Tax=Synechococcus sp. CS-1332 TaxID=2847972 RepID=UPI00223AFA08|nr:hypothetical protein [Synechococcus sp. CS-1332]MCT0206372.1 hypothetical protein [Synechococcus sp. CS-1332]